VPLALLLVGTGCLFLGLRGHEHPLAGPVSTPATSQPRTHRPTPATSPATSTTTTSPAKVQQFALRSTPVALRVPAIALDVSLSTLGLNLNGTVQVPTDIQQPGWYRLGPSPGQDGSAVILGHVDSYQGPAVFYKLRSLVAGDLVDVSLADGVSAQFKVTNVAQYLKSSFPDQLVYAGHGQSTLQLVTCGGAFDSQTGHYLSNIVVYTTLVTLTPPAAATAAVLPAVSR
jgi:sortase (surface protein transpeptidase)